MATIKDIAKKLGVSSGTVSKGLNGASDISESMRQSVLNTAIELGYKPKNMQGKTPLRLCVMVENMNYENVDQFGYEIISGFEQAAGRRNYEISIVPTNLSMQTQEQYDSFMLKNGYTAAFLLGFTLHDDYVKQLDSTTVPTVLLDHHIEDNPLVGYVGTDNYQGMKYIVNHLADLGHKRIAIYCGDESSMITERRFNAFKHHLWCNHIEGDEKLIAFGDYHLDQAAQIVPRFMENGATAIVCLSDAIAACVIRQLSSMGLRVPEDISVTGFDDIPLAAQLTPPLTTIRQNRVELGRSALILLDSLINNVPICRIELRPHFIERSSTALVK